MKTLIFAVAMLAASVAHSQDVVIGGQMQARDVVGVDRTAVDSPFLRIATAGGTVSLMTIDVDGGVTLKHGATFGFSPTMVTGDVGHIRGYVVVRVGAEYLLMPVYTFKGSEQVVAGERP